MRRKALGCAPGPGLSDQTPSFSVLKSYLSPGLRSPSRLNSVQMRAACSQRGRFKACPAERPRLATLPPGRPSHRCFQKRGVPTGQSATSRSRGSKLFEESQLHGLATNPSGRPAPRPSPATGARQPQCCPPFDLASRTVTPNEPHGGGQARGPQPLRPFSLGRRSATPQNNSAPRFLGGMFSPGDALCPMPTWLGPSLWPV